MGAVCLRPRHKVKPHSQNQFTMPACDPGRPLSGHAALGVQGCLSVPLDRRPPRESHDWASAKSPGRLGPAGASPGSPPRSPPARVSPSSKAGFPHVLLHTGTPAISLVHQRPSGLGTSLSQTAPVNMLLPQDWAAIGRAVNALRPGCKSWQKNLDMLG